MNTTIWWKLQKNKQSGTLIRGQRVRPTHGDVTITINGEN